MKTVVTITCHKVYNHGASLQQFALLKYLSQLGHDAMTVNYQPDYLSASHSYFGVENKKFRKNWFFRLAYMTAKFPAKFKSRSRRKSFDRFEENFIASTTKIYKTNEELKKSPPVADFYITGSDQVWNPLFENGKDPALYLNWVPAHKMRVAYAPSFATDAIPNDLKDFVKTEVSKLDFVSVRECSAVKMLESIGINNTVQVLDPVFLLSAAEWTELFIKKVDQQQSYVLVYDFDNNENIRKHAFYLKEKFGYRIIALNRNIRYADKVFWSIGPAEFLNLIYGAEFILGNSFHSTVFAVIFGKQFLTFNRSTSINTRMRDFLLKYNLQDRLRSEYNEEVMCQKIPYEEVNQKLNIDIIKSKEFLQKAIQYEKLD